MIKAVYFTEEAVLNPSALPRGMPNGIRYYRAELIVDGEHYPIQYGGLWLPSHIDIALIEDVINEQIKQTEYE